MILHGNFKPLRNVKISGTGSYLPSTIISNHDIENGVDTSDEWIFNKLGIRERRIVSNGENTSDIGSRAALNAISHAKISVEDIDLIICATSTPDRLAPSTSCIIQDKIQAYNAVCFDLNAVCSGFLFSLSTAAQFISTGMYENVLVIGADTFSKITDWSRRDCVFFGDGAGAAILTHTRNEEGFLSCRLYSDGRGKMGFTVPGGGSENPCSEKVLSSKQQYFRMNGKEVYETAITVLPQAINRVLKDTNMVIGDIDLMIPHQPSINILKETARRIGLPFDKVKTNMEKYANTSAGTIPILLDEINKDGLLKVGDNILFAAVGSGWTWGASIIHWG